MSGGRVSFLVELDLSLGVLGENQLVSVPSAPRAMVLAVPRAQRCALERLGIVLGLLAVHLELLPVVEITLGNLGVVDDDGVVGLRAESGRGPVGRAEKHGTRVARLVHVDDELVVADLV